MTEANPGDRELHLEYSDPFHSPTERLGSEASMRRLFLVHFSCPLCGQEHSCEIYLTLVAQNEDELMERALETLGRDDIRVNSLAPFARRSITNERGLPGKGHRLRQAGNQAPVPGDPGGHDRRGELYLRVLQPEVRDHRRLAAARREEPKKRGEAVQRGGDGPVPEDEVAGPRQPAASEARTTTQPLTEERTFRHRFEITRPEDKKKPRKVRKPEPRKAKPRKAPTPKRTPEEQREARRAYEQARNQQSERKEAARVHARKVQKERKETGQCRSCSNKAIPGQTRCENCRDKHRLSR